MSISARCSPRCCGTKLSVRAAARCLEGQVLLSRSRADANLSLFPWLPPTQPSAAPSGSSTPRPTGTSSTGAASRGAACAAPWWATAASSTARGRARRSTRTTWCSGGAGEGLRGALGAGEIPAPDTAPRCSHRLNGAVIRGFEEDVGTKISFYGFTVNTMKNSLIAYEEYGFTRIPQAEVSG